MSPIWGWSTAKISARAQEQGKATVMSFRTWVQTFPTPEAMSTMVPKGLFLLSARTTAIVNSQRWQQPVAGSPTPPLHASPWDTNCFRIWFLFCPPCHLACFIWRLFLRIRGLCAPPPCHQILFQVLLSSRLTSPCVFNRMENTPYLRSSLPPLPLTFLVPL